MIHRCPACRRPVANPITTPCQACLTPHDPPLCRICGTRMSLPDDLHHHTHHPCRHHDRKGTP